jgi:hypothetical protein
MALAVSGENVTARLLSAPVPEPPPLSMPPIPPPLPVPPAPPVAESTAASEPVEPAQDVQMAEEPAAPPAPPMFQVETAPRATAAKGAGKTSTMAKSAGSPSALWVGGGVGLAVVIVLGIGGYLFMSGAFGGKGKSVVQTPKSTSAKKKVAAKNVEVPKEEEQPGQPDKPAEATKTVPPPVESGPLKSFPPPADFSPPGTTPDDTTPSPEPEKPATTPEPTPTPTPPEKPAEKPEPEKPLPEKPQPEKPATEKPDPAPEPKSPPEKEKTKPEKAAPKTVGKKVEPKKPAAKGPPPATADCEVCRGRGLVPLKKPQPYVWMEGQPVPKGALAVREMYCPNCKPDADNAELAAAEDVRLKTAMDVHLEWEKKTSWQLVRAETRRTALHSQLPPNDTQRVALALESMNQHIEGLTGSLELTQTTPANCNVIILAGQPNYLQFVNLLKADPVFGPARQDWSLVGQVAGTWVKDTIFYRYSPEGPPPEHQGIVLVASYQIRGATNYKDPPWLNVGYCAYCENTVLKANRVTSLEYALTNLRIDPDWSLAVRRLAAAGGLKPWNDMFPKLLRDYQAEDHLTAYAMVAFLIQYKPQKFLEFVKETKGGLGSAEALEKAYGEKVPELQQKWVKALGGR